MRALFKRHLKGSDGVVELTIEIISEAEPVVRFNLVWVFFDKRLKLGDGTLKIAIGKGLIRRLLVLGIRLSPAGGNQSQ